MPTGRTDLSVIDLINQQQVLQRDTTAAITKLFELQTQFKNDHFLADIQTYDDKGDKLFIDWTTKPQNIANLTQLPIIQLAMVKTEGIVYKLTDGIPQSSMWDTAKKRWCQLLIW